MIGYKGGMPQTRFTRIAQNLLPNPGAEMLRYGWRRGDVLSLGQGEGSTPTPDFISQAAEDALRAGKTFYGPVLGLPVLREALSQYYRDHYQTQIAPNRIFVTGSGTTAMHLALTSVLDRGDDVIAVTPIWKNLLGAVALAQATTTQIPLTFSNDAGWTLDMQTLLDAITDKTKAVLIVTPSNPTGWTMSRTEMEILLSECRRRNIWIISDEVYGRTNYDESCAPSFLSLAQDDDLVMTVNSFSKSWAMTGWRLGWLTGPPMAEEIIRDIALYDNMGPPAFTQFGGIAALQLGEDFIQTQKNLWRQNYQNIAARFDANNNFIYAAPQGGFYWYFKVRGEDDCLAFCKRLIDDHKLGLAPGCAFGQCGSGWMRLCYAVAPDKLDEALNRLESATR